MIDINKLCGEIKAHGYTHAEMADLIGIHPVTFSNKMRKGVFNSSEMQAMVDILSIKNPEQIFFAKK